MMKVNFNFSTLHCFVKNDSSIGGGNDEVYYVSAGRKVGNDVANDVVSNVWPGYTLYFPMSGDQSDPLCDRWLSGVAPVVHTMYEIDLKPGEVGAFLCSFIEDDAMTEDVRVPRRKVFENTYINFLKGPDINNLLGMTSNSGLGANGSPLALGPSTANNNALNNENPSGQPKVSALVFEGIALALLKELITALETRLSNAFDDSDDDYLGSFAIVVRNENNIIKWLPRCGPSTGKEQIGDDFCRFEFVGSGAHYRTYMRVTPSI